MFFVFLLLKIYMFKSLGEVVNNIKHPWKVSLNRRHLWGFNILHPPSSLTWLAGKSPYYFFGYIYIVIQMVWVFPLSVMLVFGVRVKRLEPGAAMMVKLRSVPSPLQAKAGWGFGWMFPKMVGVSPKSAILIGCSIIFTIHFGGFSPYFWKHPGETIFGSMSFVRVFGSGSDHVRWWRVGSLWRRLICRWVAWYSVVVPTHTQAWLGDGGGVKHQMSPCFGGKKRFGRVRIITFTFFLGGE